MNINWRGLAAASALGLCITSVFADEGGGKFALAFRSPTTISSAPGSLAATAPGSPLTLQTDNIHLEALVNWGGPPSRGGLLVYNGHGCCSGWGLLLLGDTDPNAGKIAILAGGITVATTPLPLPVGAWTHVSADRVGQDVIVTVQGTGRHDRPQSFDVGIVPVNPLGVDNRVVGGGIVRLNERFSVGDSFNGIIDNVKMSTLDTNQTVDSWTFKKVTGFSAVGQNGNSLDLQSANWIDISGQFGDDDD